MSDSEPTLGVPRPSGEELPKLDETTRVRLGEQLKRLYDPVVEEQLDPHLVELLQRLAADR